MVWFRLLILACLAFAAFGQSNSPTRSALPAKHSLGRQAFVQARLRAVFEAEKYSFFQHPSELPATIIVPRPSQVALSRLLAGAFALPRQAACQAAWQCQLLACGTRLQV
jgi:hypothetical protein